MTLYLYDEHGKAYPTITSDHSMCRRSNSPLQSIPVFSLDNIMLGIEKVNPPTMNTWPTCPHTRKTLPSFPLNPPLDTPKRTSPYALIRLISLPAKLKLVHLKRTEHCARRQSKRYLCRASGARMRLCARECALQHRGASRGGRR